MGSPVAPGHSPHSLSLSLEFGGSRGIFPGIRDGGRGRVLVPSPWAPRSRACGSRWESPDLGRFNPKIPGWEPRAAFPERGRAGSGAGAPEPPPPGRHRRGRPAPTGASPAFPVGPEHPRHSRGNRSVLGIPAGSAPTGASPAFRGNRSDRSIPSGTGASSASPAFPVGPERPRHSRRIRSDRSIPGIPAGSPPTGGSAPLPPGLGSAAAPVPLPAMSSAPSPSREPPRYLSQAEAEAMEKELLEDYRFGRQQLIEIWGHACAVAVTKDYEPTIFYPKRSPDPLHRDFTTQCEKMDIPFLSYLPTEVQLINDAYNAVVDAVLGAEGTQGTEGTEPCAAILATLRHVRIPIVSLDVPSGWLPGPVGGSGDISPDVLVSLAAPKEVARRFRGRRHFLAGRFVPEELRRKFGLSPPEYPGSDCVVAL
ncbi:yjeF N-terminal domain-containing protein 3 isoform X2 [Zonotrichia albicollis]|uniref:yjeF N-terminal domain-containing protein 3 isoform X2 n=2 Tax=Zonotrichia TaxID=44387 RepID=UPI003D80CB1B